MRIFKAMPESIGRLARWSIARPFAKSEDGAISVEMGFAAIVFTTMLTGLISFGSLFFVQGSMADTARDTVRRVATGELTPTEAQTYAQNSLINWGMAYSVTATNDGTDAIVNITVPMADAALVDFLGMFSGELASTVTLPVE